MHPIDGNSLTEAEVGEGFLEKVHKRQPLQLATMNVILPLPKTQIKINFHYAIRYQKSYSLCN
jgi:hypothetical protein